MVVLLKILPAGMIFLYHSALKSPQSNILMLQAFNFRWSFFFLFSFLNKAQFIILQSINYKDHEGIGSVGGRRGSVAGISDKEV